MFVTRDMGDVVSGRQTGSQEDAEVRVSVRRTWCNVKKKSGVI